MAGKWRLPQGYVEFDEDFLSAAIREVKEETGLDVEIRSILNVVSNALSPRLHTLAIILLAGIRAGEPRPGDDLETLEWFPPASPHRAASCAAPRPPAPLRPELSGLTTEPLGLGWRSLMYDASGRKVPGETCQV